MRRRKLTHNRRYKRRKKRFYRKGWFWRFVLSLLLFSGISWLLFNTSYFQIKNVEVTGGPKMADSIRNVLGQNLNFFLLNSSYIAQEIRDSLPKIEDIQIQREFPDKISISITKKKAIGIVCVSDKPETCFLLASDGTIFEKTKMNKDLPTFFIAPEKDMKIGDVIIKGDVMEGITTLKERLEKINILIKEINILPHELTIKTRSGFYVYFSKDNNFKTQLNVLINALYKTISKNEQKNLKYIDLRGIQHDGKGEIYFK